MSKDPRTRTYVTGARGQFIVRSERVVDSPEGIESWSVAKATLDDRLPCWRLSKNPKKIVLVTDSEHPFDIGCEKRLSEQSLISVLRDAEHTFLEDAERVLNEVEQVLDDLEATRATLRSASIDDLLAELTRRGRNPQNMSERA